MCTNAHGVKQLFSKPMAMFAVLFHITSELNKTFLKKHRRDTENNKVCLGVRFCLTFYFVQKRSNVKKCTVLFSADKVNSRTPQHEPGDLKFYDI